MKTQAEGLNEAAGCKLFAERLDEHGLPVDGWAWPVLTITLGQRLMIKSNAPTATGMVGFGPMKITKWNASIAAVMVG